MQDPWQQPAEDGRRSRPPAGPALRRVEEVVTSRNRQRIDRPLLPEQAPSGRLVSGTAGQAVSVAKLVSEARPRLMSGCLPHAGH
jgi:hypothetical protein